MKDIVTNNGKKGGWLKGKPHYDKDGKPLGGIKAIVTDTGKPVELEGGEVIINKYASAKHWKELSKINQSAGNGVAIGPPTSVDEDPEEFKDGGRVIEFNANHLPNNWILSYAKKIKKQYPKVWDLGGNIFGNKAFENLERVAKRGYWLDDEKWMYIKWRSYVARHKGDFRIEGVIAMLKWVDKVDKGWPYMKDLIENEIQKRYKKNGGEIKDEELNLEDRWDKKREHIETLANNIQSLRYNVTKDLSSNNEKQFLTALIISIMDNTGERVGNEDSASNGHFGITGLHKNHVKINGNTITLKYIGKTNVAHDVSFTNERIAKALNTAIKNSKSKNIFETSNGFLIKNDRVNRYLNKYNVTAKDIRGYSANKWVTDKLKNITPAVEEKDRKKQFNEILKKVAQQIGHGKATLKKHYLIPELENAYIEDKKILDIKQLGGELMQTGGNVLTNNLLAPNGKPSNLTPEQYRLVRTPAFKKWFGDWEKAYETGNYDNVSKIIDDNGEPLVVYRGNRERLGYEFTLGHNLLGKDTINNFGHFFTPDKFIAERYAEDFMQNDKGYILEVFLNAKKVLDLKGLLFRAFNENFIQALESKGVNFSGFNELKKGILNYEWTIDKIDGTKSTPTIYDYFDFFPSLRELFIKNGFEGVEFLEQSRGGGITYVVFNSNQIKLADGSNTTFDTNNPDIRYKNGGELEKGIKTELEHKDTIKKISENKLTPEQGAKLIAKDHLKENSKYYTKLQEMESKFDKGGLVDKTGTGIKVGDQGTYTGRLNINVEITKITDSRVYFFDINTGEKNSKSIDNFQKQFVVNVTNKILQTSNKPAAKQKTTPSTQNIKPKYEVGEYVVTKLDVDDKFKNGYYLYTVEEIEVKSGNFLYIVQNTYTTTKYNYNELDIVPAFTNLPFKVGDKVKATNLVDTFNFDNIDEILTIKGYNVVTGTIDLVDEKGKKITALNREVKLSLVLRLIAAKTWVIEPTTKPKYEVGEYVVTKLDVDDKFKNGYYVYKVEEIEVKSGNFLYTVKNTYTGTKYYYNELDILPAFTNLPFKVGDKVKATNLVDTFNFDNIDEVLTVKGYNVVTGTIDLVDEKGKQITARNKEVKLYLVLALIAAKAWVIEPIDNKPQYELGEYVVTKTDVDNQFKNGYNLYEVEEIEVNKYNKLVYIVKNIYTKESSYFDENELLPAFTKLPFKVGDKIIGEDFLSNFGWDLGDTKKLTIESYNLENNLLKFVGEYYTSLSGVLKLIAEGKLKIDKTKEISTQAKETKAIKQDSTAKDTSKSLNLWIDNNMKDNIKLTEQEMNKSTINDFLAVLDLLKDEDTNVLRQIIQKV